MARLLSFFSIATASLRRRQESRFHIFIPTGAARPFLPRSLGFTLSLQ